jgi:uroporphyrinogen-III synthase
MKQGVLITRPQPLAARTAAAVAALGYVPYLSALLKIEPIPFKWPGGFFNGMVFTSATVFNLGFNFASASDIPLYLVGRQTEAAAREAGFTVIRHVAPDVTALAAWLNSQTFEAPVSLLYYRGIHQAHDLAALLSPTIGLQSVPVYDSHLQKLPETIIHRLRQREIQWIMLYSRRTSAALAAALKEMSDKSWCAGTSLLCLSSAVMAPLADLVWRDVTVAATPDEAAMLAGLQQGRFERDGDGEQDKPR